MKVDEAVMKFLGAASAERNLSPTTIKAYAGDLRLFASYVPIGDVSKVSTDNLRSYVEGLERSQLYQDTTVRRRLATLKVFFSFLETEGVIHDSPARRLRGRYTVVRRLPRVMSLREVRALLRVCRKLVREAKSAPQPELAAAGLDSELFRSLRNLAAFELLFATGMRIGELVALDITDVNLRDRTVRILGKGRRERMAFISSEEALRAIREYLGYRALNRIGHGALFLNKTGGRLTIYSMENSFGRYLRLARIRNHYTPHCLRHTMATMLLNNGADIRSVQEILGHRTIVTTQIYTEVSMGQKRRTMMKFHQRNRMQLDPDAEAFSSTTFRPLTGEV